MNKILICAAVDSEISLLANYLDKNKYDFQVLGIGMIESAISITHLLSSKTYSEVIFTGTCGAYPDTGLKRSDLVNATIIHLGSYASAIDKAYIPEVQIKQVKADPFNINFKSVACVTVLDISKSASVALSYTYKLMVKIEHLELFAVALACQKFKVSFKNFMAVSNIVHENSHEEWKQNHLAVSIKCQEKMMESLK